jgi:hypothetical protein
MIDTKTTFVLVVPKWQNKVRIGTVTIAYYEKGNKLPVKYIGAKTKKFGKKEYYIDNNGKKIVKNPESKGNPIYWSMNGQSFYSNNISWKDRSTIVNFYHRYFTPFINKQLTEQFPIFFSYKIRMEVTIYETFTGHTPDITNMWILSKILEDTIVECGILRDDSPEFRSYTGYGYKQVEKEEDRKLVVTFKYVQE